MTTSKDITRDAHFYVETLTSIPDKFANLLSTYTDIPKDQQISHITSIRASAYAQHPYPCLGRFRFLDLDLSVHPLYVASLLPRLKDGEHSLFLDLGCCIGQDLRKIAADGVPPARLYGADLVPEFIDVGYQLFRDEAKFPRAHFLAPVNALDDDAASPLRELDGKVTDLHVSAVFHLFSRPDQLKLATRCLALLRRDAGKCLILGSDASKLEAGEFKRPDGVARFRHNGQSWRELWEEVAQREGVIVEVGHEMKNHHPMTQRMRVEGGLDEVRRKVIGSEEDGFRWGVWWIWVDFAPAM